jgi:3-hydroxybutyryl-CoA dehydrogenase
MSSLSPDVNVAKAEAGKVEGARVVCVVGFGKMGRQIVQVGAQAGYSMVAVDLSDEVLRAGLEEILEGKFGLRRAVERGLLGKEEADEVFSRIKVTTSLDEALRDADVIIEAVVEDVSIKKEVFRRVSSKAKPSALIATNTSTISVTELASSVEHPHRFLGLHFFNPAQVMKLVEVVRGLLTSEDYVNLAMDFVRSLGKVPILVRDSPGFIASRINQAVFLEASKIVEEGVASVRDVDLAVRLGLGYPMGPFELTDYVGLDLRLKTLEAMREQTGDPRYTPPKLLRQLVASGYVGLKPRSRGGYYEYFKLPRPSEEGRK